MLIGQPKSLDEFPALTPEQVGYLAMPILQALQSGHPLDVPVQIDFGVVCQLLSTVKKLGAEVERLTAPETLPPVEEIPFVVRPFPTQE